jgi:hypothetical protein
VSRPAACYTGCSGPQFKSAFFELIRLRRVLRLFTYSRLNPYGAQPPGPGRNSAASHLRKGKSPIPAIGKKHALHSAVILCKFSGMSFVTVMFSKMSHNGRPFFEDVFLSPKFEEAIQ